MNELRRMAYLDALGIDSYVSRVQLPGAAQTRRLAIVPVARAPVARVAGVVADDAGASPAGTPGKAFALPGFTRERGVDTAAGDSPSETSHDPSQDTTAASEPIPRFNLVTMIAGNYLWLEELSGMPLTTDQVQLVQSMARALTLCSQGGRANPVAAGDGQMPRPEVAHFEWPMHNNRQLDQGEQAARAGVAAFVSRKLEESGCRGLVLLGQAGARRVTLQDLDVVVVGTLSSAEILANPATKRQVWRDLQPLLGKL